VVAIVGVLESTSAPRRVTLGERVLVGRGPHCTLRLDDPLASSEHARLRWREGKWSIRDLGSSNGTLVDDIPLVPGKDHPLAEGALIHLGNREMGWRLTDVRPPQARATSEADEVLSHDRGILTLPAGDTPECQVFLQDAGWVVERRGVVSLVRDQQVLELESGRWQLELPLQEERIESTYEGPASVSGFDRLSLHFRVSHDGDDVTLSVGHDGEMIELGARAFGDMLLSLAEARLNDAKNRAELPTTEHGWVYVDDLIREAHLADDQQLNQYVFHARKQLARLGVDDAARLIERRRSGRLRLGTARVVIDKS
jgi:FHA domain